RHGETKVTLHVDAFLDQNDSTYTLSFGGQPGYATRLVGEHFHTDVKVPVNAGLDPHWNHSDPPKGETSQTHLYLQSGLSKRLGRLLSGIEVHLAHEVIALWRLRERQQGNPLNGMREPGQLRSGRRLEHGGGNLASVFQSLKNEQSPKDWSYTVDLVRLGLGREIEDLSVQVMDSGYASLLLRFNDGRQVRAAGLSDGQLNYLCFVAIARSTTPRSVLLVDEPELHLHPGLVGRVADMMLAASEVSPVIVATHSNSVLDAVEPSCVSVVQQVNGETQLRSLDAEFIKRWRQPLSQVRAEHGDSAMVGA
ncbi:MAG: AAA family ATPase, partial [Archangium sp.]|nr:AAA family ATPase [Archangium sp.]